MQNLHVENEQSPRRPERVISLVPSVTESLFALGLGSAVVGVTDFCTPPEQAMAHIHRVGGVKDARLKDILALNPDLVIANVEENNRELVEGIQAAGVSVWVTFPKTVRAAMDDLWTLAGIFQAETAGQRVRLLETTLDWVRAGGEVQPQARYFCPIWQDATPDGVHWWMTFNDDTYSGDLLGLLGGENCFSRRERKQPLAADLGLVPKHGAQGDVRYPRVIREEVLAARPELVLLPSEPYAYTETELEQFKRDFAETPAVQNDRVHLVDGSLLTWYGTRLGKALEVLPDLLSTQGLTTG